MMLDEPTTNAISASPLPDDEHLTSSIDTDGILRPRSSSQEPVHLQGSLRATGSKIANLRAQFEKDKMTSLDAPKPKRVTSSEQGTRHELESEISKLRQQLKHEAELRIAYEDKCTNMEEEIDELQASAVQPEKEVGAMNGKAVEPISEGLRQGRTASGEVGLLQQQVADLKRSISMSTRIDSQVTDSSFAQEMETLYHEVQNWVVNNFRRAKADLPAQKLSACLVRLPACCHPDMLSKLYAALEPSTKLSTFQATVITCLLDVFSEHFLYGVADGYSWYSHVCEAAKLLPTILPAESYNKWRAVSFDQIRQSNAIAGDIEQSANQLAVRICDIMCSLTDTEENEGRKTSLAGITRRAIAVAHLFRVQRPQYEFTLPAPGTPFDSSSMENVATDGELSTSVVRCTTWPAITKIGDEHGSNTSMRGLVMKAKVVCGEP